MKIHSFVDVITNSSTSVYQIADSSSVRYVADIINTVLSLGESNKTCDDLFKVELDFSQGMESYMDMAWDTLSEWIRQHPEDERTPLIKAMFEEYIALSDIAWSKRTDAIKARLSSVEEEIWKLVTPEEVMGKSLEDYVWNENDDSYEYWISVYLKITPRDTKDEKTVEILNKINNLFSYEASYN